MQNQEVERKWWLSNLMNIRNTQPEAYELLLQNARDTNFHLWAFLRQVCADYYSVSWEDAMEYLRLQRMQGKKYNSMISEAIFNRLKKIKKEN